MTPREHALEAMRAGVADEAALRRELDNETLRTLVGPRGAWRRQVENFPPDEDTHDPACNEPKLTAKLRSPSSSAT